MPMKLFALLSLWTTSSTAYIVAPAVGVARGARCDTAQRQVVMKDEEEPKKKPGIDMSGL